MDPRDVLKHLKAIHQEVEADCGKDPARVTDSVQPLEGLGGFDSPLIPTVVRMLAKRTGVVIPPGTRIRNPYISADRTRKLPLNAVAERFCELYGKENKK